MSDLATPLAIETRALTRRFGAVQALKGVNLHVPTGSVFGLVGPNGAGKTTTFSILCGFLSPTSGEALVLGHPAHDRAALMGKVGALPQDAPLPRMKALDALRYWAELGGLSPIDAEAAARSSLEQVGLASAANRRASEFSHGMQKRVAIAQAFLGAPQLVLLDEPTSGLDPKSAHEIKQLIRARKGLATIVISSHDLAQIEELCDALAIIDRGQVVQQGQLSDVTGRGELVRLQLADPEAGAALAAVQALAFATEVAFEEKTRVLSLRLKGLPAEDAIPAVLHAALGARARIVGVTRGQRLEERVLELT